MVDNSLRCICICINILFFICTAQSAQRLILLFSHVMRTHYNCSFNCNCVCVCVCAVFWPFVSNKMQLLLCSVYFEHTQFSRSPVRCDSSPYVRCVFVHIPHFSNELATLLIQSALPACLRYELHHFQTHIETHRHYIACHHTRLQ